LSRIFGRFLCNSSSAIFRGWSNIRVISRTIPITVLFICLAYIHLPFYYTLLLPQRTCAFTSSTYQAFYALWNLIFWSWIPSICMLIFGLLTVRNVRRGRMRVAPKNCFPRHQKKTDRQLIQMLLIQCFVFGSTTTAFSIGTLYISITNNLMMKTDLQKAKDNYLTNILNSISNIGPCMSFYLFTLSSQLFRRQLMNLFCWRRPVQIVTTTNRGVRTQAQN
jgi:magnesium-transporting ATPase (P-type)